MLAHSRALMLILLTARPPTHHLSRRARPYVTGCASLVDDKTRRLRIDKKGTVGPAIIVALAMRACRAPPSMCTGHSWAVVETKFPMLFAQQSPKFRKNLDRSHMILL